MMKRFFYIVVLGVLLAPIGVCNDSNWVDSDGVLFGNSSICQKPAKLDFDKVWKAIPEIVQIRRERPGPARREILKARAAKKFKKAVRATAHAGGYDCIVKASAITGTPPAQPVDVTKEMIRRVKKMR